MTTRVLVIEDDGDLTCALRTVLARAGYTVVIAATGRAGLRAFHDKRPAVVILDLGLPVLDGWEVLERVRDMSDVPVLILTADTLEADKVRGLRSGADDYLTKPFSNQELLARIDVLLRRRRLPDDKAEVYDDGRLRMHYASREVLVDSRPVPLTPLEFRLLSVLVSHTGQVLSPGQLLERAWGDAYAADPRRVKFSIMRLRRKLGWVGSPSPIQAVRGFGYRYVPPG